MSTEQLEALIAELSCSRDRIREIPGNLDTPHGLSAAMFLLAGQVDRVIQLVDREIESRAISVAAMEIRRTCKR